MRGNEPAIQWETLQRYLSLVLSKSELPDVPSMQTMNACCIALRPSAPLPLMPALESKATALNMQLQNTIVLQRHMVRDCVKTKLFRRLNFFKKGVHGL